MSASLREDLRAFRAANQLPADPATPDDWSCRLGPFQLTLPNFNWRRRAVGIHDAHHLLTGYPCTLRGECQTAAWEFAAGRFRHPAATLFCLPLVSLGGLLSPRAVFAAYVRGRRSRSLYARGLEPLLLETPTAEVRRIHAPEGEGEGEGGADLRDRLGFASLLLTSIGLLAAPLLVAILIAAAV